MEYISLIMLLLWGWGIWSFIALRSKIRKINPNISASSSDNLTNDWYSNPMYSSYSGNIYNSNND